MSNVILAICAYILAFVFMVYTILAIEEHQDAEMATRSLKLYFFFSFLAGMIEAGEDLYIAAAIVLVFNLVVYLVFKSSLQEVADEETS